MDGGGCVPLLPVVEFLIFLLHSSYEAVRGPHNSGHPALLAWVKLLEGKSFDVIPFEDLIRYQRLLLHFDMVCKFLHSNTDLKFKKFPPRNPEKNEPYP